MRTALVMTLLALAMPLPASATEPATNAAIGTFNFCVRRMAVRLEPSDANPEDIGKAAVTLCIDEEIAADNMIIHDPAPGLTMDNLQTGAISLGITEAVVARLCRKARDCELANSRHLQ